ncbi:MAG: CotH kinase family protein [Niabella sp.]
MNKIICFLLFFVLLFNSGCKKDDNHQPEKAEIKKLIISARNNASLTGQDIVFEIRGDSVIFNLPDNVNLPEVYLSYNIVGASLLLQGNVLDSTKSVKLVDKTSLRVITKEGTEAAYVLYLKFYQDNSLAFTNYKIEKSKNTAVLQDILFTVLGDTLYGTIPKGTDSKLIATYETTAQEVWAGGIKQLSGSTVLDFAAGFSYTLVSSKGIKKSYYVKVSWVGTGIPQIFINTDGGVDVISKDDYLNADVQIVGNGAYGNYAGRTKIKGRGNSTWAYPKKPYRLKLDSKAALLGLASEKDWVLLANYLDGNSLCSAVAMQIGKYLNIPFTNTVIPVELTLNGQYKGLYLFTEQVEVDKNRVDIGDNGVLLELDTYFDEDWKFHSDYYYLPVMVKNPELSNSSELNSIKADFTQMESLIASPDFPNNNYEAYFDTDVFVRYLITYLLTDNEELNHPKSTYLYKAKNGKYTFGPLWDFDWAYGYEGTNQYFSRYDRFFWDFHPGVGTTFIKRLIKDPKIKTKLQQEWASFKLGKLPLLLNFVDEYATLIADARARDYQLWRRGGQDLASYTATFKTWLQNRADYLTNYINDL